MASARGEPIVVDLFAGAGGLGLGAHMAGAHVAVSLEIDPDAADTLEANGGYHGIVLRNDVSDTSGAKLGELARDGRGGPLIVIGGPPCQPFSKASYWLDPGEEAAYRRSRARGEKVTRPAPPSEVRPDERRDLVYQFWRVVSESRADAFVFENVPSIKHPRNRKVLEALIHKAEANGFYVASATLNAAKYGVAQTRERVFVLGSRIQSPALPNPTHDLEGAGLFLEPAAVAGDVLRGFEGDEFFEEGELVQGRWAEALKEIPPGWNYKALTEWAGHPDPLFETETRFWNFLLKLSPDRPSWTIAANPGPWTGPFHWSSRRLRTVELAALQSFPKGYRFEGNRRSRVRQIGNAVPPQLARHVVRSAVEAVA